MIGLEELKAMSELTSDTSQSLDNISDEKFMSIIECIKTTSDVEVKMLATQLIAKFCKNFDQYQDLSIEALGDECNSGDVYTRRQATMALAAICQDCNHLIPKVTNMLIQLYEKASEKEAIDESLMILINLDIEKFLRSFYMSFENASKIVREKALKFLASKINSLVEGDLLNRDIEEQLIGHSRSVMVDMTSNDELITFVEILSKLNIAKTEIGQAMIVSVIKLNVNLEEEFDPNDIDSLEKFLICTRYTVPMLSKCDTAFEYANYISLKMLPHLSELESSENDLRVLQALAEMSSRINADNIPKLIGLDECQQAVFDKLLEYLPLPQNNNDNNQESEGTNSQIDLKFSFLHIEYLMYTFHQFLKLKPDFLTSGTSHKELSIRLQYLTLDCTRQLRLFYNSEELDSIRNKLLTVKNILTLAKDLIISPPKFECKIILSNTKQTLGVKYKTNMPSTKNQYADKEGKKYDQTSTEYRSLLSTNTRRRSSLQDEPFGGYSQNQSIIYPNVNEEQLIRQRYAWFPPSLKTLDLVDQYFSCFPRDKIPFNNSLVGTDRRSSRVSHGQGCKVSSYRDDQISFQLPRQDISSDYCSYPLNEASRKAYQQFVEKRNTQALDVANVIQIQRSAWKGLVAGQSIDCGDRGRTVSGVSSDLSYLMASNPSTSGQMQIQRCRRCLVRFEDTQLAVVAPNFIIGSAPLYGQHRQHNTNLGSSRSSESRSGQRGSMNLLSAIQAAAESTSEAAGNSNRQDQLHSNVALFHPNCFTCSTCKEFLVDLVYCLRDNKLYCLRHYGESLRPRCSWCQEVS